MKFIVIACLFLTQLCFGQTESTLLVLTNRKASVLIDGELKAEAQPNIPVKISTSAGEHYAQVQSINNGETLDKAEIVQLEAGKQKILKLLFDDQAPDYLGVPIRVTDLNFSIPGGLNVTGWQSKNPNQSFPYPSHYYAFEKGDVIVINASMSNKNGTNIIEVSTFPDGVLKYSNNKFSELVDIEIKVEERSIYKFEFATNHTFDRNCFLKLSRKPLNKETENFNSNVVLKRIYTPVSVVEPTALRVNSGSNAFFAEGKSRILVPVKLPPNTREWFYRFSASRNPEDIENIKQNFQLFGELSKLLLTASGFGVVATKAVDIGVDQLSSPPGANYCDVMLLDYENISKFEAKIPYKYMTEGSRQNLMSGNVKVSCCAGQQVYLGIRNPDSTVAVNVSIEVIAITEKEEYVMQGQ